MNIFFRVYKYPRRTFGETRRKNEGKPETIVRALPTINAMRDVTLAPLEPIPGSKLWRGATGRKHRWDTIRKLLEIGLVENVEGKIVEAQLARKPVKEPA